MTTTQANRKLKVFLCHSSHDKPAVREIYTRLQAEGWIDPWLDEEKLFPGQDWDLEIEKAVEETDAVLVLLSKESVEKESYVQYELRNILHIAKYKPQGAVFVLPVRLDDCEVPRSLRMWHHVDYFPESRKDWAYGRILGSMKKRAKKLGIDVVAILKEKEENRKQELAEKARKKQAEQERKEKDAREVAQKTEHERIAKEKREAEEKARLEKEEERKHKAKEKARKTAQHKAPQRKRLENFRMFFGEMNVLIKIMLGLGIAMLFLLGYILSNTKFSTTQEPTKTPTILVPATKTHSPIEFPATSTPNVIVVRTMISEKDEMTLVYVPAGEFQMGRSDGDSDEKPVHTVYLDAYWVDQTEVTNAMYAKCVEEGVCTTPKLFSTLTREHYFDNSEYADYPVLYVSWEDANNYCIWAKRRLPTEAEWEKAAVRRIDTVTSTYLLYPWGDTIDNTYANYHGSAGDTTMIAKYEKGKSFYGAYDMAGNVWEWVADWYTDDYYANSFVSNPLGPEAGDGRVLRGGSWSDFSGALRSSNRNWSKPSTTSNNRGFRCAIDAD